MRHGALRPYERALLAGSDLVAVSGSGRLLRLDVRRWLAPIDAADRTVLARCLGPTLDVGCGPGRFVQARAAAGHIALGVDIAATAVELTTLGGAPALLRSVFGRVPGEGRWQTVLLMDGNVGIGGEPVALLSRLRHLLAPGGQALVETDADAAADERLTIRFADPTSGFPAGPAFGWALTGRSALRRYTAEAGLRYAGSWNFDGRTFVRLAR